jgi:two-component system, NtrC family, response regulator AtoC
MGNADPAQILIADDEPLFLRTTAALLKKAGYRCLTAPDGATAINVLRQERVDLVLSDLNMPGNLKLELLHEGRSQWPDTPIIVITGAPSLPTAIESVRLGITDYLLKPVKYEDLLSAVSRTLTHRRRTRPQTDRIDSPEGGASHFPDIIGESSAMQQLFQILDRVVETDTNVLLTGESGTGKEIVAQSIHNHSARKGGRFQVVDCTAIPETLFESVLFGHAKGAFTSAVKDQAGLLKQADGGTAFFDEIGELPVALQAKLLRLIQEQTFTPVGKTEPVQVDTRFICATNRDLEMEVNAGRFRRDLFYRLAVIHIELPPLRERGDDVLLLARHFLERLRPDGRDDLDFSPESMDLLKRYSWPGNIRELRNAVERGIAMAGGQLILPEHLPAAMRQSEYLSSQIAETPTSAAGTLAETVEEAERSYLVTLLRQNAGNVASSARQAGMSRQGLHKLLKKHNVDAADYRE